MKPGNAATPLSREPDPAGVLTRAALRAAELLQLRHAQLAAVLGVSAATVSRLARAGLTLEPSSKPWEHAVLFVRAFRALDAIVGGDDATARAWLDAENLALGARPRELIMSTEGLVRVVHYLDAMRAPL